MTRSARAADPDRQPRCPSRRRTAGSAIGPSLVGAVQPTRSGGSPEKRIRFARWGRPKALPGSTAAVDQLSPKSRLEPEKMLSTIQSLKKLVEPVSRSAYSNGLPCALIQGHRT